MPASQTKLHADGALHRKHVFPRKITQFRLQPLFADGGDLIRHGFSRLSIQIDRGLTRINPGDVAGDWNNLDPVQTPVGSVITDNHGWTRLLDSAAQRRVKINPPNLTAQHLAGPDR